MGAPPQSGDPTVTPEMIEAGALVLREYADIGPYSSKHLAEWVYLAMQRARPAAVSQDHAQS
jgi:hypothetical protein